METMYTLGGVAVFDWIFTTILALALGRILFHSIVYPLRDAIRR